VNFRTTIDADHPLRERNIIFYKRTLLRYLLFALLIGSIPIQHAVAAEYESTLTWHRKARLSTPVPGVVTKVTAQVGQIVKSGDVLMKLDDKVYKAEVNKNKAKVNYLQRLYKEAKRELQRNVELHEQTVLSDHELELANIAYANAKAAYSAAGSELIEAKYNLKYSVLRAPFDGVVVKRNVEIGEIIINRQYAEILFELAESTRMVAQILVSTEGIKALKLGQSANIVIGQKRYTGKIQYLGMQPIAGKSSVYPVRVMFDTNGIGFRDGQSAKVKLK
jgi:multidrug efflux system membrane fusion protein